MIRRSRRDEELREITHTEKEHKSENQQMEGGTGGTAGGKGREFKRDLFPPGVPQKMQMRKVIKTRCLEYH